MENFQRKFTVFMNVILKVILLIITIVSFGNFIYYAIDGNIEAILITIFFIISILIFYYLFKKGVSQNKLLIGIIIYAFVLRLIWIFAVDTIPVSDFKGMLEIGEEILNGNFSMFKDISYYARFPHLTITVLYFALIRSFFTNPLIAIKFLNIIYSTLSVFISYLIVKEAFNSKEKGLVGGFIAAIYPSIIVYTSINCGENMAIPFYLLSVYLFILAIKGKKPLMLLVLSAISLSMGNLFRMVAMVMVVAYIMYILIYFNKKFIIKIKSIIAILAGFFIPLVIVSFTLKSLNITEFNLWHGSESSWTSILKGSNIEYYGRFTSEDAKIPEIYNFDYEKVEHVCKDIVKERLRGMSLPKFIEFYIVKYSSQWKDGDCGGVYWATENVTNGEDAIEFAEGARIYANIIYAFLLFLTYIGLYNKEEYNKNRIINLFYIIFGGFVLFYLISEKQERYAYIVNWLFIILPITGLKPLNNYLKKYNFNKFFN